MRLLCKMLFKKYTAVLCIGLSAFTAKAQHGNYPKDYFRNPLDIPIFLAGNFGECRPNHFHSGIDIKTQKKENLPVYAAAEGYISRIKMEPGGFGHALYITHPKGYTTLYAHLNDFMPAIQKYVRQEQYKKESWELDLVLDPSQFPLKKGEQIAWSGNTGGSTAPHLHFEIRDTKTEHPLNPLLFGFKITDNIAPRPLQIALYDLNQSTYEQDPKIVALKKGPEAYSPTGDTIVVNTDLAGIGVHVNDYMNGSDNTLNFYKANLYLDDQLQASVRLDDIGYDVTRYIHAYVDYKTRKLKSSWIQCLFQLPGNHLDVIYPVLNDKKGALKLADGKLYEARIELIDASGNISNIQFKLMGKASGTTVKCEKWVKPNIANKVEYADVRLLLDNRALYDWTCFKLDQTTRSNSYSNTYAIHKSYVPVHTYYDLYIKPNRTVPAELRDKIAMVYTDGRDEKGDAATYDNGWYKNSVRNFGNYRLVADTIAPFVKPLQANGANLSKASRISFTATDATTSVDKFRAELDGKWLLFEERGKTWFYEFDEHCPKGKHELVVTATDENGNTRTLRYTFVR